MLTEAQKKYCAGLIYLRAQLRKLVAATGATGIIVDDGEGEKINFATNEPGIIQAADYATEVDGVLAYQVDRAVLHVLYDGPYNEDSAEEIINDTNGRAEEILS